MGKGESAPVKLRRLFFLFLSLSLLINVGSLLALIYTQDMALAIDQGVQPALFRTGEFVSVALEARLDLYRFLSDYTGPDELKGAVGRMQGGMGELLAMRKNAVKAVPPAEFDQLADEVKKLGKLYELLVSTRASERFSEQNLLERQVEEASAQVLSQAQGMRERLKIEVQAESRRLGAILLVMRFVFLGSLAATLVIAVGMFFVWKRFEASFLGI